VGATEAHTCWMVLTVLFWRSLHLGSQMRNFHFLVVLVGFTPWTSTLERMKDVHSSEMLSSSTAFPAILPAVAVCLTASRMMLSNLLPEVMSTQYSDCDMFIFFCEVRGNFQTKSETFVATKHHNVFVSI